MYKAAVVLAIALVGRAAWATAGTDAVPATLLLRGEDLARARVLVRAGAPAVADPLAKLRLRAARALAARPVGVTEKRHPQPGLDPHDYVSLATYYWPDPTKPDGLLYVSRDGEQNPEIEEYDFATLGRMQRTVHNLAHAWYFTGERRYAEGAARQLRAWFVDPVTRMNPNLRHAQMIRGKDTGRSGGIIDLYRLPALLDDVRLLRGAPGWTDADEEELRAWCRDYLTWLRTSEAGREEADAENNHGSWYDVQAAALALFVGDRAQATEILERTKTKRIATQIEPDGRQPFELRRTLTIDYTLFNLEALFTCARLGEHVGLDLWSFRTPDGRGLRPALDWMLPYALGEKPWEGKQIRSAGFGPLYGLLRLAAVGCREPAYEEKAGKIDAADHERMWVDFYSPPAAAARTG